MAGDGTDFTINIDAPADNAAAAASVVDQLAASLDTAKSAAEEQAAALAAAESSYKRVSGEADKAARAFEALSVKVDEQRAAYERAANAGDFKAAERAAKSLAALEQKQAAAQTKAEQTKAALEAEAVSLDKVKASAEKAAAAETNLTKQLDFAKKKTDALAKASGSGKVNEIAEGLGKLGGPLGSVGQKVFGVAEGFKKMSASLGSAGPYVAIAVALAAVAVGAIAVAAAMAAATLTVLKFAVANADAARTAKLLEQQAKGGAAGLEATKKLALSLDSQSKKLKENIGKIFSVGEKPLERFLEGLSTLVALFDENTASGNAIKVVFQSLFNPLLDGITALIPKLVAGFIQFEILVLKALIAIKPFGSKIQLIAEIVGVVLVAAFAGLALIVGIVLAGVAAMAVGAGVLAAIIAGLVAGVIWLAVKLTELGSIVVGAVVGAFQTMWNYLSTVSLSQFGIDLITGLAQGITGAAGAVLQAITGVVTGAIGAAKSLLGIASPSKVFAEIGGNTAEGMAGGVDEGAGQVQASFGEMVAPPAASPGTPPAAAPAATAPAGAGATFHVTIQGGGTGKENAEAFAEWFFSIGARAGTAEG